MRDKIYVTLRSGQRITLDQWQEMYGLPVGSDQIGKHFSWREPRFTNDLTAFGSLEVNELLMRFLDAFREDRKAPVNINSFNRTADYQQFLKDKGKRTAKYSPHVAKLAADIDTPNTQQAGSKEDAIKINRAWAAAAKAVAKKVGIKIRVGNEQYLKDGSTFIHVDVCPEYYASGKPYHTHFHPSAWETELSW